MNSRIPYVLILTALAQLHAQQSATHLQLDTHPPKLDCNKLDFMKERKPIFGASPTGSHVGIAVSKTSFDAGEPVLVDVWIDNQTEHETFADRGCERPIDTPLYRS